MSDDFFEELDNLSACVEPESKSGLAHNVEEGLQKLAALVESLSQDLCTSTILERAMSAAIELTGAERGFLVLVSDTGEWSFRVARNMEQGDIADAEGVASHTVIKKVLEGRQPLLINDVIGASDLTRQQSIAKMQVRSIMGAPLLSKGKLLGAAYVDTSRLAGVFDQTSLVLFETFVRLAAVALENARLIEAEQEATSRYRSLQEFLDTVLSSQPHGIVILDSALCIEYCNPQAVRFLDLPSAEPGATFLERSRLREADQLRLLSDLQKFLAGQDGLRASVLAGDRVLAYSFFHVHSPWRGGSARVGIILEDVTLQKQLERKLLESERQATINQLAGGIAHEINNSLQPVKGRVELLAMRLAKAGTPLDGAIEQDLETISALSTRIEKIAQNLRHLSKPAKPEFEPVDLARLVRSTVDLMESTTGTLRGFSINNPQAKYRIVLDLDDSVPPIQGDRHGLESALINMILNACHAIREKGSGTLTLRVGTRNGAVWLAVEDTGTGIPPEVLPRVFEPYFTTRADCGGTGLGMSILKNVADIHDAKLDLHSEWGVGTTVTLLFPLHTDEEKPVDFQTENGARGSSTTLASPST